MTAPKLYDVDDAPSFYEQDWFKEFQANIVSVLVKPLTQPEIRRAMERRKLEFRQSYFFDAVRLSDNIQEKGVRHYEFVKVEPKQKEQVKSDGWNGNSNAKLFAKSGKRPAGEQPHPAQLYGKDFI